ncbi:MAG TPA: tetratricopeptide repeat protein [Polyangia bacterium]|nr:tetratricopeptide repeat protein [Polyangia bacterium]
MNGVMTPARRWAVAVLLPVPLLCAFDPLKRSNKDVEVGNTHMKAGKAEEALGSYERAVAELPADPAAHFDRGTALFALSRFEEAGQEFLRATEAKDSGLKEAAFYNLGNAFFKKDKFKEAVEAYKRALTLDPRDSRAKWNLEIALKKQKEEEKKNEQDKGKNDQDKKDKKDKDDKKDQQDKGDKKDKKDKKDDDQKQDKKEDQKDEKKEKKADKDKNDNKGQQPQQNDKQDKPADEKEIEAVLDSLDRSPKDLERERARMRAVRRRPPTRDW